MLDKSTLEILEKLSASGMISRHGVLIGTQVFSFYSEFFRKSLPESVSLTSDFDIWLSPEYIRRNADNHFQDLMSGAGLYGARVSNPAKHSGKPTSFKLLSGEHFDFMTSHQRKKLSFHDFEPYQMQDIDFLVNEPNVVHFSETRSAQIPSPLRYALHKMVMAQHRVGGTDHKAPRDYDQASWIIEAMSYDKLTFIRELHRLSQLMTKSFKRDVKNAIPFLSFTARRLLLEQTAVFL